MAKNSPKNYDRWGGVTPVKVVKPTDKKGTNTAKNPPKSPKK